ncbi:hypothetical protein H8959_017402 [Pygathrix nigripes]
MGSAALGLLEGQVHSGPGSAMLFCSFFRGEVFQNHLEPGVYICAKCGYELFPGCSNVAKRPERNRPEVLKVSCGKCGNALSHESLNHGPKL